MEIVELPKANFPKSIISHSLALLRFLHLTAIFFTNTSGFFYRIRSFDLSIVFHCSQVQAFMSTMWSFSTFTAILIQIRWCAKTRWRGWIKKTLATAKGSTQDCGCCLLLLWRLMTWGTITSFCSHRVHCEIQKYWWIRSFRRVTLSSEYLFTFINIRPATQLNIHVY